MTPRAVFGVPLHVGGAHAESALTSLLGQTERDVRFVLVEDGADATTRAAAAQALEDPRVVYVALPERTGLVAAWRRAHAEARSRWPEADFFAWGSDHDEWYPEWLEALADELDAHPDAVLAYPLDERIDADGTVLRGPWRFTTAGTTSPSARFRRSAVHAAAGNMIYGLFRSTALDRVAPFPAVVGGDRLLLAELSLVGEFRQVERVLWRRRFAHRVTSARQRRALFPTPPRHTYAPWWLVHAVLLTNRLVVEHRHPELARAEGAAAAGYYAAALGARRVKTRLREARALVLRALRDYPGRQGAL